MKEVIKQNVMRLTREKEFALMILDGEATVLELKEYEEIIKLRKVNTNKQVI